MTTETYGKVIDGLNAIIRDLRLAIIRLEFKLREARLQHNWLINHITHDEIEQYHQYIAELKHGEHYHGPTDSTQDTNV